MTYLSSGQAMNGARIRARVDKSMTYLSSGQAMNGARIRARVGKSMTYLAGGQARERRALACAREDYSRRARPRRRPSSRRRGDAQRITMSVAVRIFKQ